MIHGSFILADDTDTTVKIVFFAIVGVGWLLAQIAGAAKKSAKKTAQRPRSLNTPPPPFANTPPPPSARQPPLATFIGRPGGSATTLQDARRVAQARAVQARAAAARAAQLQAAQARAAQAQAAQLRNSAFTPAPAFPPPAPRRGEAAGFPPAAPPFAVEQLSKPLAQSAPASVVTAPARRAAIAPPPTRAATPIVPASRRSAARPNLTPQSLRSQFILTEILSPPVTLRQ